jgi:protein-S-isoprenylcysteine O-methyltransferase Ste14
VNGRSPLPVPPPILALALVGAASILSTYVPIPPISIPMHLAIGVVFVALGTGISASGAVTFKRFGTPLRPGAEPTHFVTTGPYRMTRNPMYLGLVTLLIGWFFLSESPYFLIPPVLFFLAVNFLLIPFEERLLVDRFGKVYDDYRKRVRRWV